MQLLPTYEDLAKMVDRIERPMLVYDIETGPLPHAELLELFDEDSVKLPKKPERFKLSSVAFGNMTDPEKKVNKVEAAKKKKALEHREWATKVKTAKDMAFASFEDDAMGKPETGEIVAVGYGIYDQATQSSYALLDVHAYEDVMLEHNISIFRAVVAKRGNIIGHNIEGFDVPFLMKRCWLRNLPQPFGFRHNYVDSGDMLIDTQRRWFFGERHKYISLNRLCQLLGIKGKYSSVNGKYFAKHLKEDADEAMKYLEEDIRCTMEVARKMGIF